MLPVSFPRIDRRLFLPLAFLFLIATNSLHSQVETGGTPRYPGTTGEPQPLDTTSIKQAEERRLQSAGLLEGPIDPDTYILGPNDQLTLSIINDQAEQKVLIVTPDSRLVLPVGEVDVRNKTLTQARQIVRDAVLRIRRAREVSLSLTKIRQFKVQVTGAVRTPGAMAVYSTTRVSEAISLASPMSLANLRNVKLRRGNQTLEIDLFPYYSLGEVANNPFVREGDVIIVGWQDAHEVVAVYGAVNTAGEFSYREGDSISSVIRYTYGFKSNAFLDSIEVASVSERGDMLTREFYRALPDGTVIGDRPLKPGDRVFVREIPKYREVYRAVTNGAVRYPGSYPIEPDRTTVRELIAMSGGFNPDASTADAILIRPTLRSADPRVERILQIDADKRSEEEQRYLISKYGDRPEIMTINFARLFAGDARENIVLKAEDSLYVPSQKGTIALSGKVANPGSLAYQPGLTYRDYIALAGGFGWKADESETQVIKGKTGEAYLADNDDDYRLEPGDKIYVPEETPGTFWQGFTDVVTVVAQLGTIVAVVISILGTTNSQ